MPEKLKVEKLVEGGQAICKKDDKIFFVWNALPGEEIEIENANKRKGVFEAKATRILKPSSHRIDPEEEHFLSCSPWSMMDFDYENQQKTEIAIEDYRRIGKLSARDIERLDIEIFSDKKQLGYRNKMEFSFIEKDGQMSLAFFNRGQKRKTAIDGCELATISINETAKKILAWINENSLTERNLKSLVVRSNMKGEAIAGLFIKDKLGFEKYPKLDDKFLGFNLYYSTHKSPASVITEILYQEGRDFLVENILDKKFKYGINSFFQVNIPVFEVALKDIAKSVGATSSVARIQGRSMDSINSPHVGSPLQSIVDFYSGVGAIGICAGANKLIESNEEAISFAQENIALNNIEDCDMTLSPAEKTLEYIKKNSIIIFDPPRAGLHQKIIDRVLEAKPQKIIYLSCNIATQARDIGLLKDIYNIELIKLYNFFPRTPHIEGLAILQLK